MVLNQFQRYALLRYETESINQARKNLRILTSASPYDVYIILDFAEYVKLKIIYLCSIVTPESLCYTYGHEIYA
jgi:hypothetical protein